MVNLHFVIASAFLIIGLCMRFGLWNSLVIFAYEHIPKLRKEKFDEFETRRFVGETSIKLGMILLAIAFVGIFDKKDFNLAIAFGWFSFVFYAIASVTFIDKVDIFDKRRKAREKAKLEHIKAAFDAVDVTNQKLDSEGTAEDFTQH